MKTILTQYREELAKANELGIKTDDIAPSKGNIKTMRQSLSVLRTRISAHTTADKKESTQPVVDRGNSSIVKTSANERAKSRQSLKETLNKH